MLLIIEHGRNPLQSLPIMRSQVLLVEVAAFAFYEAETLANFSNLKIFLTHVNIFVSCPPPVSYSYSGHSSQTCGDEAVECSLLKGPINP